MKKRLATSGLLCRRISVKWKRKRIYPCILHVSPSFPGAWRPSFNTLAAVFCERNPSPLGARPACRLRSTPVLSRATGWGKLGIFFELSVSSPVKCKTVTVFTWNNDGKFFIYRLEQRSDLWKLNCCRYYPSPEKSMVSVESVCPSFINLKWKWSPTVRITLATTKLK